MEPIVIVSIMILLLVVKQITEDNTRARKIVKQRIYKGKSTF